ncbi:IGK protein, partial [Nothoprocta ornata]|nr:IGK protein [Nothoprocta pentlandii]NWY02183.1 IGK protein [Nothoprocta ornata]
STVIHWYQQKDGKPPERLLYFSQGKTFVESGFQEDRYLAEKVSGQDRCVLTIKDVTPDDAATYYCAYWDAHFLVIKCISVGMYYKVFGTGTKLIVSDKGYSPPKNHEVLSSENENKLTYVCLVEKFYPEVIRVSWTDGKKEVTDNVEKGEIWKSADDGQYSIGSWLTVSKENKNKKYSCKYEHESGTHSFDTFKEGIYYRSKTGFLYIIKKVFCILENSLFLYHLIHRTAYLVYIVLLLKSFMYYVIVLFFIYR